ncbi:hypothetical protein B484DRAFT_411969 [Ochromonadaceae sp. CCMP2298]|nr:hypothetical protein B484DRAFT_411969 [Ochromonadaceae sp. CCMP2298]
MDYEMPVLNGPSATRLLREQGCSCFIFGVTGNVMQKDIDFFISCGADAVFAKRFVPSPSDDDASALRPSESTAAPPTD